MLVAAEMNRAGLPWRADVHREVLTELLGERYAGGGEPRRLAELADEVSHAFGRRMRPDLPADVVNAFAQAGIRVRSTRRWEIEGIDHPAVKPLLEYKRLYRIWVAHGWSWLHDWVRDGRFRPEFLAGGTVTGRWVTNGGGALQIPKVIRRACVADPGWRLVVADADQMEPRVLAAISRDPGLMEVAGRGTDLYQSVSDRAFSGDRDQAKLAVPARHPPTRPRKRKPTGWCPLPPERDEATTPTAGRRRRPSPTDRPPYAVRKPTGLCLSVKRSSVSPS
jgi:DNA polymerase-1